MNLTDRDLLAFLRRQAELLLLLDYDGTLIPIQGQPDAARPDAELKDLLARLTGRPRTRVAIVSGRALSELQAFFNIPGLILAGDHGSVLQLPGQPPLPLLTLPRPEASRKIYRAAQAAAAGIAGLFVEDKGISVALHYRLAEPAAGEAAAGRFRSLAQPYLADGYEALTGKMMLEVRPRGMHKGLAVRHLTSLYPGACPCYFGDDRTDEDALTALDGREALRVWVGQPRPDLAAANLKSPGAVRALLAGL